MLSRKENANQSEMSCIIFPSTTGSVLATLDVLASHFGRLIKC